MCLKKKKSKDATWTQTAVPDAKTEAYAPTVTIKNGLPYLQIIVGIIIAFIAFAALLGIIVNMQVSLWFIGVVDIIVVLLSLYVKLWRR